MYFIKAQEHDNAWWRYLLTLLITFFTYLILGAIPLGIVIGIQSMQGVPIDLETFSKTADPELLGISQNAGLILLLFPAVLAFFALWISIVNIHNTTTGKMVSATGTIRWKRLFLAAFVWLLMLAAADLFFYYLNPGNYVFSFDARKFLPLVLISLALIPFQAWFEELLFRGYLMQGIGLLFRQRWLAVLLTAAFFGLLHSLNPEVQEFGFAGTMPYYIGFGVFTGLLVVYDKGIEMACGIHAINNIYSSVLVSYEASALNTPALATIQKLNTTEMSLAFLVMAVVFILIMSRKYSWPEWNILVKPIPPLTD